MDVWKCILGLGLIQQISCDNADTCYCLNANETQYLVLGEAKPLEMDYFSAEECLCVWRLNATCESCYIYAKFRTFDLLPPDSLNIYDANGFLIQQCLGSENVCSYQETSTGAMEFVFRKVSRAGSNSLHPEGSRGISAFVGTDAIVCPVPWRYVLIGGALLLVVLAIPVLLFCRRRSLLSDQSPLIPSSQVPANPKSESKY